MNKLLPKVQEFIDGLKPSEITNERKKILMPLIAYIKEKLEKGADVNLNFICTHNSRRSQLSQVWAYTLAFHFDMETICAYSGGTEATALHQNAIKALANTGFKIAKKEKGENPVYFILSSDEADPLPCFSKLYNDPINCSAPFAAVMNCSEAEFNCPKITEAEAPFPMHFDDPKTYDGTSMEGKAYADCNREIATEMLYVFTSIQK